MENLVLQDKDGNKLNYNILFSFDIEKNNKTYIIYTDNSKDSSGNLNLYSACYLMNDENHNLLHIETDDEINLINSILEHIREYNS